MNSATLVMTYKNEAGTATVKSTTIDGDMTINVERSAIPAGSTDLEFVVQIPYQKIKAFAIGVGKTGGSANAGKEAAEVTVKTNTTAGTAVVGVNDIFTPLTPVNGKGWMDGGSDANPFTVDVTKFYVSTSAGNNVAQTELFMRFLLDSTPGLPD